VGAGGAADNSGSSSVLSFLTIAGGGAGAKVPNNGTLGGHVEVEDHAIVSGLAAVHQFCRIGEGAMIGGCAAVTMDVIPFGIAAGNHARLAGLNMVGLKRSGADRAAMSALRAAFRELFIADGPPFRDRIDPVAARYADVAEVQKVIDFIRADEANRPICLPARED
jgi:UDP-N-acetylglucosamine acyltransferase